MKFLSTLCTVVEVVMRLSRVPDRHGQVWQKVWIDSRKRECSETLLVVDEPYPLKEACLDKLVSDRPVWMKCGWVHKVVDLDSNRTFEINENWFGSWSEDSLSKGDPGWKRLN